jgi:hypothetical protein
MRKPLIIALILSCFFGEGTAQLRLDDINQKYEAYQAIRAKLTLHLIFNQEKFIPGDTVCLKAYFLKEDFTGVPGIQLVTVNLSGIQGESIGELKFLVRDGIGQSQMILPDTLASGIYYLTAYNTWMRNFDPPNLFKKKILIVNKNAIVEVKQPFLQVAVEGGNLISDVPNRIGIYTHRAGTYIQINDGAGREVGRTLTDSRGTGSLLFTPVFNERYIVRIENDTIYHELPVARKEGVVLQVRPAANDEPIRIRMISSAHTQLQELFVVITARGKIKFSEPIKHTQVDSIELTPSDLPYGLVQISVLDVLGNVIASRNVYNHFKNEMLVDIQPDQDVYKTRDKIRLNFSIKDLTGNPLEGEFSIRAVNATIFETGSYTIFPDELTLAELQIPFVIERNQDHWHTSLDNFLLATTKSLPWATILSKQPLPQPYPLTHVFEKSGKVYFADSDVPLPDLSQISFYLQHDKSYVQTFTTDNGNIGFTLPVFYGYDEFFYMARVLKKDNVINVKVIWKEDSFQLPQAPLAIESDRPDTYATFMTRKRLIDQSYNIHNVQNETSDNNKDIENELWEADISVKVDEYILFSTMSELINEIVPALYYRKTKRGDVVRVQFAETMQPMTSPLYIIDGIATRNTGFFLSLKPSAIKTIEIVNSRSKLNQAGLLGRYGIVMVTTREGNVREPLDTDSKRVKGLNIPLSLNMHDRPAANTNTPDFRSTIYWNPSVKTDADGKATVEFYGSDDIGKVTIFLDGFTKGAQPFSTRKDVNVVLSPAKN